MKWIDGREINFKNMTGESICEKLTQELWNYERSQWLSYPEFVQTAAFLIDFDTELQMEGIFTFLENTAGHYAPEMIKAFRTIGDAEDAEILSEICRLAPPDSIRKEIAANHQEYEISSFQEEHVLCEETVNQIEVLENQLYLNTGFDIWPLLFAYLDSQIQLL